METLTTLEQIGIRHAFEARLAELNKRYRVFVDGMPHARRDCAESILNALALYRKLCSDWVRE